MLSLLLMQEKYLFNVDNPICNLRIFRYLYLVHMEDKGGEPDKVLLEDQHILITVLLYAITVIIILLNF